MPKILLESIKPVKISHQHETNKMANYCPECGELVVRNEVFKEYVCSLCRHIVKEDDRFCSFCGAPLDDLSPVVEHYFSGKLTEGEFQAINKVIKGEL